MRTRRALGFFSLLAFLVLVVPARPSTQTLPSAPPLAAPAGSVVNVATEAQLQDAVRNLRSGTTIVVAPGTYQLTATLAIDGSLQDVGIVGATGSRDDVVLVGPGMTHASYGLVPYGIWVGGARGVTIANLTVRDV